MAAIVIRLKGISKRFPGTLANDGIDLTIEPGRVHALLGENGAGKTTLMNILSGRYQPDAGEIFVAGSPLRFRSPKDALRSGIGMVHQHFMLVANQTVAENVALGLEAPRFLLHRGRMAEEVRRLSVTYGLPIDPHARINELSLGEQQRVEILKLLFRNANLLILDEPTAVLTSVEIAGLFATLRRIVREGRSVIFITHKLDEVMEIADQITVLRRGRRVADLTPADVESRRELARLMVGREVVLGVDRDPVPVGEVVLELRECSGSDTKGRRAFRHVSFAVRRGEVFSIVGVAGNGQTELVSAITGESGFTSGQALIFGRRVAAGQRLAGGGVGFIPEDRTGTASVADLDLTDNVLLTTYRGMCRGGLLRRHAARRQTEELLAQFQVAAPGPHALVRQLSGGNLQKLILARELSKGPRLIVADHPTHGLDIGATVEVWRELLRRRAEAGILLISGDLTEALSLSDRIAVIFRGEIMGVLSTGDADALAEIGPMMAGVKRA
jgi:simple sugar transport system ATP-binding protein